VLLSLGRTLVSAMAKHDGFNLNTKSVSTNCQPNFISNYDIISDGWSPGSSVVSSFIEEEELNERSDGWMDGWMSGEVVGRF
jgi:hypothetical protein